MYLVSNINSRWPEPLLKFYVVAQIFAFEVDVASWRCLIPKWNFLAAMVLQYSLPLLIALIWVIVAFASNGYIKWHNKSLKALDNEEVAESSQTDIENDSDPTTKSDASEPPSPDLISSPKWPWMRALNFTGGEHKEIDITWMNFKRRVLIILESVVLKLNQPAAICFHYHSKLN